MVLVSVTVLRVVLVATVTVKAEIHATAMESVVVLLKILRKLHLEMLVLHALMIVVQAKSVNHIQSVLSHWFGELVVIYVKQIKNKITFLKLIRFIPIDS
jgi:hypothetical protein